MEVVHFRAGDWLSGPVNTATSFMERWRGLRGAKPGAAMLIQTNSVHGMGMRRGFRAIGLSSEYRVVDSRLVAPGRFVRFPGCEWILELPERMPTPDCGEVLELIDV